MSKGKKLNCLLPSGFVILKMMNQHMTLFYRPEFVLLILDVYIRKIDLENYKFEAKVHVVCNKFKDSIHDFSD